VQRQTKEEGETNFTAESTFGHSTTLMFVFPAPLPSFFTVCSQQTGRLKKTCFNLEIEAPCSSSSIQPIEYLSILYLRLSRVSCQTSDAAMLPEKEIFVKFGAIDAHFHGPSVLLEISTHASYGVCFPSTSASSSNTPHFFNTFRLRFISKRRFACSTLRAGVQQAGPPFNYRVDIFQKTAH
jgi:hypothetical protein